MMRKTVSAATYSARPIITVTTSTLVQGVGETFENVLNRDFAVQDVAEA